MYKYSIIKYFRAFKEGAVTKPGPDVS